MCGKTMDYELPIENASKHNIINEKEEMKMLSSKNLRRTVVHEFLKFC